jgi:hypothetical protein
MLILLKANGSVQHVCLNVTVMVAGNTCFCLNIFMFLPCSVKQVLAQLFSEKQYLMVFVSFSAVFE